MRDIRKERHRTSGKPKYHFDDNLGGVEARRPRERWDELHGMRMAGAMGSR